jgi:hypothetical protein
VRFRDSLVYVYAGRAVGEVALVAACGGVETGAGGRVLLGVGLVAAPVLALTLRRMAHDALALEAGVGVGRSGRGVALRDSQCRDERHRSARRRSHARE